MGREVKRVALDFNWPLNKVWKGFINPWYKHSHNCSSCAGTGLAPAAKIFKEEWYGNGAEFDPKTYGNDPFPSDHPPVVKYATRNVENDFRYYSNYGKLSKEQAIKQETERLLDIFNGQWCHHLIQEDVDALIEDGRLSDFTGRLRPGQDVQEFIRTRAYYLWIEAGSPNCDGLEFWLQAEKEYEDVSRVGDYLPHGNGYIPTAKEVNDWSIFGFGHDCINCFVCVKARCKREGVEYLCKECKGNGSCWDSPESKESCDNWEETQPPEGEGYQIWETVSEGSPISPVFADPEELASWMSKHPWGADKGSSKETWLKFILGPGWAPSFVGTSEGLKDGVEAMVNS